MRHEASASTMGMDKRGVWRNGCILACVFLGVTCYKISVHNYFDKTKQYVNVYFHSQMNISH